MAIPFSRNGQTPPANGIGSGSQLDFDVIAEAVQALHQLAFREIGKIAAHQARDLGMRNPHPASGFRLGQPQTPHRASDFNCQAGLDFELLGVRQVKVSKDIPGTDFGGKHRLIIPEQVYDAKQKYEIQLR